ALQLPARRARLSRFGRGLFARVLTITWIVLIAALPVLPVAHVMLFCHITSFRTAFHRSASALTLAGGVAALSAQQPQAPRPAAPQNPQPISLVQLAEMPRLFDPQLSPDGKSVAYMLGSADWNAGRLAFHLWRQNTAGGGPVALTPGSSGDVPGANRWSPDGSSILFGRAGQLMLIPAAGGEPRAVTKIYFLATDAPSAAERDRERRKDDVYAFEENYRMRQLWSVSVSTGAEKRLTTGEFSVASYRLSRDGRSIAVERAPTPLVDDSHRAELWVMDATGANQRQLTANSVEEQQPELSPDGSQILFLAETNEKFEPYYNSNLFLMPAAGGAPRPLIQDFRYAVDQATWAPDGKSIFAVVSMGVHTEIFQFDVASKKARQLTDGRHFIPPGFHVAATAGRIAFQLDEPTRFGDVWTMAIPEGDTAAAASPSGIAMVQTSPKR